MSRQLVGVFSADWLVPYAQALKALGSTHAFIVHGRDGLDEVSISAATQAAVLDAGIVTTREITPEDAGLPRWPLADITGGDAAHNAAAMKRLFDGEAGAYRDIVLLNASAALMVAGRAKDVTEGAGLAAQALDAGAAKARLNALIKATQA